MAKRKKNTNGKGAWVTLPRSRCSLWVILGLLTLLVQGCASSKPEDGGGYFAVPYTYKGFGAGPQPVFGAVELNEGNEARTISRAVLEAMQQLQLSVIEPPIELDTLLAPGTPWTTDIAPLDAREIQEHNRRFPQAALPTDRLYGIQYVGSYDVLERELSFELESLLYHRGTASDYRRYPREDYSGDFFFERARTAIEEQLSAASRRAAL